jgi:ATP-dependent DNA helicase RecG
MALSRTDQYLNSLLAEMCKLPRETEWVEFKQNKADPEEIGEYISALSNSAALNEKAKSYIVWGVADGDHSIVGTSFDPESAKVGNEDLENWLLRLLTPKIHFGFSKFFHGDKPVVMLEIERTVRNPVQFRGQEFIRVGSYKKKLKDHHERERQLWRIFDRVPFESCVAAEMLTEHQVLSSIDYRGYLRSLGLPTPMSERAILGVLKSENLINASAGHWEITNLGAILFANDLNEFNSLRRKAVRVVHYRGRSRVETIKEYCEDKGYGIGFENLVALINRLLPSKEIIGQALREETAAFPQLAIRELVANALIHQDFSVSGAGPMIEIFEDRVEFTNPGRPLVEARRFLDLPPRSRNEALASVMRRIGICEERGSGWDKVVWLTEYHQLPAPLTETVAENTRVVLFGPRRLARMEREDRVRATYLHSCLRYVNREHMTNTSVRERFGIQPQNSAYASRLIREAVEDGLIVPYDASAAPKKMRYIPSWAAENT